MKHWIALFGLCASIAVAPAVAQEKVKVSGTELQTWLSRYWVLAGTNDKAGCVFFIVSHSAEKREENFHCPTSGWGVRQGTARVDGDRLCTKWTNKSEICDEVYRVGENRYETRGAIQFYNLR